MTTPTVSRFEGLADWYEQVMNDPTTRGRFNETAHRTLQKLIGRGDGLILDIGCGTGIIADVLRGLGYDPIGVDLAADQLRIAVNRLPVAQGNASQLPIASGSIPLAFSTFASGDYDDFPTAVDEVYRVLKPGGRYIDLTLHPCFNSGYAYLRDDGTAIQLPGYRSTHYIAPDHFKSTIRSHVGQWHRPLDHLINIYLDAGFQLTQLVEDGDDELPTILGIGLLKA